VTSNIVGVSGEVLSAGETAERVQTSVHQLSEMSDELADAVQQFLANIRSGGVTNEDKSVAAAE